jgi:DNA-binding transcriptional LysR family regulator
MPRIDGVLNGRLTDVDLDLRLVRYFCVVAEHGHFGRAAEALYLPQSSLSRQVQRLEEQLGAQLIERTSTGNHLTESGRTFLRHATEILEATRLAINQTRTAGSAQSLTVGFGRDIIVTPAVRQVQRQHPEATINVAFLEWDEVHRALAARQVDVAVARFPFAFDGLDITPLYADQRVLLVSHDHPLAGRDSVELDDFAALPLVRYPDPTWDSFWRINPRPDGTPAPDGPLVAELEEKLELVAAGAAVALAPRQSAVRRDVIAIPVRGVEPSAVVLATREHDRTPLVQAFSSAARALITTGASGA